MLHAEMVEHLACVDCGCGLWDELGTEHAVVVPDGGVVDGDLDSLLTATVCRILVRRAQVHVFCDRAVAMNVVPTQQSAGVPANMVDCTH